MGFGRKSLTLALLVGVLGIPAVALRLFCVGHSCDQEAPAASGVPFCSLEAGLRSRIGAGYREGRSPEVLVVARAGSVAGSSEPARRDVATPWPSPDLEGARVPIVFAGEGVARATLAEGSPLTGIAPTLADIIDFERPFPNVRSGESIENVATGNRPRLLLQVILEGIGSADLEAQPDRWPFLRSLIQEGAATLDGDTGSLPLEPAAAISTIGTGGSPSQHGITGEFVRTDEGRLVRAFSREADSPVIATLADDLDEALGQRPVIGLVGGSVSDKGAIGGEWYGSAGDSDEITITKRSRARAAARMLEKPSRGAFGVDRVPDLASVVLEGDIASMDSELKRIAGAADAAANGSVALVVTATGSARSNQASGESGALGGSEIARLVDDTVGERVTEAAVPGGLYLDQRALTELELSEDEVLAKLELLRGPQGPLFAEVFPAITVSFARYC